MVKYKKKKYKGQLVFTKGEATGMMVMLIIIAILLLFSIFRPVIPLSKRDRMAFHNLDSLLAVQEANHRQEEGLAKVDTHEKGKYPGQEKSSKKEGITHQRGNQHQGGTFQQRGVQNPRGTSQQREIQNQGGTSQQREIQNQGGNVGSRDGGIDSRTAKSYGTVVIDINMADSTTLLVLPQIGQTMSSRIHRYRERLGGFVSLDQLYEIKGMDTARYEVIQPYIILGSIELRKLHVNSDAFKVLLRHPYLDYDQVKAIVNYRERKGLITNWSQLQALLGECNPFLEQYIEY